MEYQQNGNIIVKGHYNKRHITPKFRNKHVRFNLGIIENPYLIDKTKTRKNNIRLISKINNKIKSRKRRSKTSR